MELVPACSFDKSIKSAILKTVYKLTVQLLTLWEVDDITKETRKNAYLYCKFRDEQLALYDEYAKRHGMLMKTLLVVNVLYYDDFYEWSRKVDG